MAAILVFFCLLANEPLLPRLKEDILLNFEFKNGATRANLQVNKRTLKWRPTCIMIGRKNIGSEQDMVNNSFREKPGEGHL